MYAYGALAGTLLTCVQKEATTRKKVPDDDELAAAWGVIHDRRTCFHGSSLVDGYRISLKHRIYINGDSLRAQNVYEHRILFSMLHHESLDGIDLGAAPKTLFTLSDLTALAEYYLILPSLANQVASRLKAVPDLDKIISEDPEP